MSFSLMIYIIFFFGFLIQSIGGFGGGLFAVPLLTLLHEPKFIVPAFVITIWVMNIILGFETRHDVAWPKVKIIVVSSWLSLPVGVYILAHLDQELIRFFISLITLLLGCFFLLGLRPRIKDIPRSYIAAGIISGLLSGSVAMGGPPLIIMGYAMGWGKNEFRATLIACFAINGTMTVLLYYLNDLLEPSNLAIVPLALFPAFLAIIMGVKVKNYLNQKWFSRVTLLLIIIIGLVGIARFFW